MSNLFKPEDMPGDVWEEAGRVAGVVVRERRDFVDARIEVAKAIAAERLRSPPTPSEPPQSPA